MRLRLRFAITDENCSYMFRLAEKERSSSLPSLRDKFKVGFAWQYFRRPRSQLYSLGVIDIRMYCRVLCNLLCRFVKKEKNGLFAIHWLIWHYSRVNDIFNLKATQIIYHYTTYEAHVIHAVAVKRTNNGRKKKDDFIKIIML